MTAGAFVRLMEVEPEVAGTAAPIMVAFSFGLAVGAGSVMLMPDVVVPDVTETAPLEAPTDTETVLLLALRDCASVAVTGPKVKLAGEVDGSVQAYVKVLPEPENAWVLDPPVQELMFPETAIPELAGFVPGVTVAVSVTTQELPTVHDVGLAPSETDKLVEPPPPPVEDPPPHAASSKSGIRNAALRRCTDSILLLSGIDAPCSFTDYRMSNISYASRQQITEVRYPFVF